MIFLEDIKEVQPEDLDNKKTSDKSLLIAVIAIVIILAILIITAI